ncbi:WD40/YVTN/BNR-like repeat-containing protein, partial [Acidobacteriota bacterium]
MDGGKNWEKVLFVSDITGGIDLELAPDNPDIVYASMWRGERKPWTIISGGHEGGVYKSSDGGTSWNHVTEGLPSGLRGKSDLAVSQADPRRVYVLMEAPEGEGGLYRSDDYGESFQLISTFAPLLDRPFYYCNLDADPTNADVLYSNSTGFYKSEDGGNSWKRRSTPHGDNHDMWINPHDPDIFIQSNDGGANVTRDGGQTWSTQNNQPTAELYQVAVDDQFPYWIYAGQQDNSTIMVPSLPPYSPSIGATGFWQAIGGCETGPAVPKPGNHNIVYANCKGRFGRYNKVTGQEKQYYVGAANLYSHNPKDLKYRFQRVSPIHVSPHDPDVVYHASQFLHRSTDEGVTWETISPDLTANELDKQVISGTPITRDITGEEFYSTIYAVQESTLTKGLIWVGANDGPVHVTRDEGKTWANVTPSDMPTGGRVQSIEPSPHNPSKAYFAAYRYLLGDWEPYIHRTNDYGNSWKRITNGKNGIPLDSPTRVVREDPDREGLLYAGTEFGMFISFDDGENWQKFQLNLPVTPVTDIKVYRDDLVVSTMGRSFWILDNITPLHQVSAPIKDFLFTPRETYRMRFRASRGSSADPEYPSPGVIFDYALAEEPKGDIVFEVKNSSGQKVRTFS